MRYYLHFTGKETGASERLSNFPKVSTVGNRSGVKVNESVLWLMLIPLRAAGPPSEANVFLGPKATYLFASNGTMEQLREPYSARERQSLYSVAGRV